jgi:pSer/pThr/pTyr-binding forkhead associated (FHA) protein
VLERLSGSDPFVTTITLSPVEAAGEVGEEEVTVTVGDVPAGSGLLVVKRGPNVGSRFALDPGKTTIGRHPDSDIFLDDVTVSRRHAEVHHDGSGFVVNDVGSLNGTYLNRERIEQADLHSGDELQIGKFRLVFLHEMQGG